MSGMHHGHDIYTSSSSSDSVPGGAECPDCAAENQLNHHQHRQERHHHEAPAYPKQHSFIVDMNNHPLYELDRRRQVRSTISLTAPASASSAVKHSVKTQVPEKNTPTPTKIMTSSSSNQEAAPAHATASQTANGKLSHLPGSESSAPFYPKKKAQDEIGFEIWIKCLVAFLVVVAFIILFAILGEVVETHSVASENYRLLTEMIGKNVSRG